MAITPHSNSWIKRTRRKRIYCPKLMTRFTKFGSPEHCSSPRPDCPGSAYPKEREVRGSSGSYGQMLRLEDRVEDAIILWPKTHHLHPAVLHHQAGRPIPLVPLLHLEDLGLVIPLHGLPPGLRIVHPGGPSVVLSPIERGNRSEFAINTCRVSWRTQV